MTQILDQHCLLSEGPTHCIIVLSAPLLTTLFNEYSLPHVLSHCHQTLFMVVFPEDNLTNVIDHKYPMIQISARVLFCEEGIVLIV